MGPTYDLLRKTAAPSRMRSRKLWAWDPSRSGSTIWPTSVLLWTTTSRPWSTACTLSRTRSRGVAWLCITRCTRRTRRDHADYKVTEPSSLGTQQAPVIAAYARMYYHRVLASLAPRQHRREPFRARCGQLTVCHFFTSRLDQRQFFQFGRPLEGFSGITRASSSPLAASHRSASLLPKSAACPSGPG